MGPFDIGQYDSTIISTRETDVKQDRTYSVFDLFLGIVVFTLLLVCWIVVFSFIGPMLWDMLVVGIVSFVIGLLTFIGTRFVLHPIIVLVRHRLSKLSDEDLARVQRRLWDQTIRRRLSE